MPESAAGTDETLHPQLDELTAFGQGQLLNRSSVTSIERHLETCLACATIAAGVPDDAFLGMVRGNSAIPAVLAANRPARTIIGFEILDEIGRGGAGVVYRARQPGLNRIVALKRLHEGTVSSQGELSRLRHEAIVLGRLRHPNIVQIHEIGDQEGHPYLALEYVAGGDLKQRMTRAPLTPRQSAELLATLAEAIAFAHGQGIVHRDLKPSNVLLAIPEPLGSSDKIADSRRQAQGSGDRPEFQALDSIQCPKIADFGLAKRLDAGADQTRSGVLMGTPGYMAPEQTIGSPLAAEPAVDIYALGAVLYELLTGAPPFRSASVIETLEQVRSREPVPPRVFQPQIPRDLETICLKCLEKSPRSRYGSAADLAADLRRFLAGQPIRARPVRMPERLWKWSRRRPAASALLFVCLLTLVGAAAGLVAHQARLQREVIRADASYKEARDAIQKMISRLGDPRWSTSPQMAELRREFQMDARPFFEKILSKLPPDDPATRLDRYVMVRELGSLEIDLGLLAEAQGHLEQAVELIETLIRQHPDHPEYQSHLADCLNKLGILSARRNQPEEALQNYQRALQIQERIVHDHPDGAGLDAELAQSRLNIGSVHHLFNRLPDAEREYRLALALRKKICLADPESPAARQALAEVLVNLAGAVSSQQPTEAIRAFEEAESLLKPVIATGRTFSQPSAVSLSACYINWGNLEQSTGQTAAALNHLGQAVSLLNDILSREPNWQSARQYRYTAHAARAQILAFHGSDEQALADWDLALDFVVADADRQKLRWLRLLTLSRLQRHEAVSREAADLALSAGKAPADLYNLACFTALACAAVSMDDRLDGDQAAALTARYAAQALELLQRASADGFFSTSEQLDLLHTDPDLAALRSRPEFQEFVRRLQKS